MEAILAVKPDTIKFNINKDKDAETALCKLLQQHYDNTELKPLRSPEDIMLDSNGLIQHRYRLSTTALTQLCTKLAAGLGQCVTDIAGINKATTKGNRVVYDMRKAISMLNEIIKFRFDIISKSSLVIDHTERRVEGIVGYTYALFHNIELYLRINEFIQNMQNKVLFNEGIIAGRRLMLRYRNAEPLFELKHNRRTNEPFFGGYHFSNSETGGSSLRAAAVIIRQWCDNKAVSPFLEGGRVNHIKTCFNSRVARLFDSIEQRTRESTSLKSNVLAMMASPLGLGINQEQHQKQMKILRRKMVGIGFSPTFSDSVLHYTLMYGSYRGSRLQHNQDIMAVAQTRNEYDLYNAITHCAKSVGIDRQEPIEQLAYRMLIGKIKLVERS